MNLTSLSQVKDWCIRSGFHPNRVLGQNFLIDRNVLDAILDAALSSPNANPQPPTVLEIGPGLGVLTEGLLSRGCAVTAIEKDPVLADRLAAALGHPENLTVLKGDALDYIKEGRCDGFPAMVSNLPYQAGTRILIELVERVAAESCVQGATCGGLSPEIMVVLLQTEVAERLAAKEGSKTRGLSGVRVQFDYDVQIVRKVSASCFWPRPEIGSTVVKLVRHHRNDAVGAEVRALFRRLTKQAFEHRRKQLGSIFKGLIESTARAEELSNEDWLALSRSLVAAGENAVGPFDF
jgi:16S rRNA (adenine1518-N6/adenine1519-N6)-dimethyltransferase